MGDDVRQGDRVCVDGKDVARKAEHEYYLLNKPKGYVCTVKDDKDRKTVMQLLPENAGRVYPVGRLDYDTEGMLLLTDDGELAFRLTHPMNEIPKTYLVKVEGSVDERSLAKLRSGVELDGKLTGKSRVKVIETNKKFTKMHVTITEGRNRQIRRMCEAVGLEVIRLKRSAEGPVKLGMLPPGEWRELKRSEVTALRNAALKSGGKPGARPSEGPQGTNVEKS